jgi:branched-subunit amino acid transport protein
VSVWWLVIILGAVTIGLKAAGTVALGRWHPPPWASRVLVLVAPVVLAALVAIGVFTTGQHYEFDPRAAGLGAALIALLLRAPLLVVVICAVAAAAVTYRVLG